MKLWFPIIALETSPMPQSSSLLKRFLERWKYDLTHKAEFAWFSFSNLLIPKLYKPDPQNLPLQFKVVSDLLMVL